MSSAGDDRGYKVVYTSRKKDSDRVDDYRPRRDYEYPNERERVVRRDYRDERVEIDRSSRSDLDTRSSTRTTYKVGRDRKSEAYLKRGDAVVVESPREYARAEYEVIRPTRNADGAYVIDLGGGRPRGRDGRDARSYDVDSRSGHGEDVVVYDARGRDRGVVKDSVYKDVQVLEDYDDDPRDQRGRRMGPYEDEEPAMRLRSAMRGRNNSPPEIWERKRSRSRVGFFRDQVSLHDASESRHERPGAEAHIAGRYLVGHRGQRVQDDDDDDDDDDGNEDDYRNRPRRRYGPQRMSDPRITGQEEYDDEKRTFTEDVMRSYEYEDDSRPRPAYPYPPQRSRSRRRQSRRHADDYSEYSEHEVRRRTEEYY
ncbi:hypothetical protein PV08_05576 [Exophiala spinifera]|uniref:Uncharacterized protein n=1 Tax=Exophiala spinifera TaxID=91928 RepID=A0A0D2BAF0_9EURO|nr:uncharacterized protein PV08_05576 [Exophiala spinifera]KIW15530.1 hypothetical protein PV08_05576 [Exophiala spinifera]